MVPKKYANYFITYMSALSIFIEAYRKEIIDDVEYNTIEKEIADKSGMPKRSVYRLKAKDIDNVYSK